MKKNNNIVDTDKKAVVRKTYEKPSVEIIIISSKDVITESPDYDDIVNSVW